MYELSVCTTSGQVLRRFDLSRIGQAGAKGRTGTGGIVARVLIGRADDCDIRIKCSSVSRHHCSVEMDEDDDWVIRDLGSTHGTVVEGVKISEAAIVAGLTVEIGPAVLRFEPRAANVGAEIARELEDGGPDEGGAGPGGGAGGGAGR